jgi:hypothetical protein
MEAPKVRRCDPMGGRNGGNSETASAVYPSEQP